MRLFYNVGVRFVCEAQYRDRHPGHARQLDRQEREAGDQIEVELEEAEEVILRRAGVARVVGDLDFGDRAGFVPNGGNQGGKIVYAADEDRADENPNQRRQPAERQPG